MASKSTSKALRSSIPKQFSSAPTQRRGFVTALNAARPVAAQAPKPAFAARPQQWRGLKTIDFAGTKETVYGMSVFETLIFEYTNKTQSERTGQETNYLYGHYPRCLELSNLEL